MRAGRDEVLTSPILAISELGELVVILKDREVLGHAVLVSTGVVTTGIYTFSGFFCSGIENHPSCSNFPRDDITNEVF